MSINSISTVYHGNEPVGGPQPPKKPAVNFTDVLNSVGQVPQLAQSTTSLPGSTETSPFTTTPNRRV
ncbi:hypothetical protein [Herbaspirillum rubrisubalbicans]|uniref:Uncharacterized protein n=1 Tax=Herbaspirillum rubrisubalbicans TaxID=80842 RepID=A0AAD0U8G4_9BURK|nr:hypothetical protein [Herbaspirillum rubrisubalbicans]AYR23802.1 hypothetical protein RC54_08155 [Herbaspirillum rubrisubalbicans]